MTLASSKHCLHCHKTFQPQRADQEYCGRKCRRTAAHARDKDKQTGAAFAAPQPTSQAELSAFVLGFSPGDPTHPCQRCNSTAHRTSGHDSPPPKRTPLFKLGANGDIDVIDFSRTRDYAKLLLALIEESITFASGGQYPDGTYPAMKSQAALDFMNRSFYELECSLEHFDEGLSILEKGAAPRPAVIATKIT